ncbi:hypothetical protein [Pseudooceanicola sp. 200-1SW]
MNALCTGSLPFLAILATGWALATASLAWLAGDPFTPSAPIPQQEAQE